MGCVIRKEMAFYLSLILSYLTNRPCVFSLLQNIINIITHLLVRINDKMATQMILKHIIDYKDGILASGLMGMSVPILHRLDNKNLFACQVISIGVQLGTQCWVSFIGGPTMFANMERHAFGDIQSKLFPK